MKTVVVYKSISGFTKKYAEWIAEEQKQIQFYYFRGGFDFNKLNLINKILMTLFKWKIQLKRHKTPDEKGMLAAYSKPMDFTKKENIKGLVEYVRSLR